MERIFLPSAFAIFLPSAFAEGGGTLPGLVLAHLRHRAGWVAWLLGLALALSASAVLPPLAIAALVDRAISGAADIRVALIVAGAIAALAAWDGVLTLARRRIAVRNELAVREQAASARFHFSMRLPMAAFGAGNEAALIRAFDDLDTVVEFVAGRSIELFAETAVILSYAILMLVVEPRLAAVFFMLAAAGLASSVWLGRAVRRATDAWLPWRDSRFAHIVECITSMLTIKTLHAHTQVAMPFAAEQAAEQAGLRRHRNSLALTDSAHRFWSIATPGIGTACGVVMLINGQLTAGNLVLFLSVSGGLVSGLSAVHQILQEFHGAQASLARMRCLTTQAPEPLDEPPAPVDAPASRFIARGLRVTHAGSRTPVLDQLDLTLAPGEHLAIIGRSGAGKTTLAHALARLITPEAGAVLLDGTAWTLPAHRRAVLLVPHAAAVFSASLRENVRLWDVGIDDALVRGALAQAGLDDLVAQWADGLDTVLGARGNPLSAGQRQRLGLARVFLRRPAILILDEATSAMDVQTESEVLAHLRIFMRGRGMIVITHREAVAAGFDRVLRMDDGRLHPVAPG